MKEKNIKKVAKNLIKMAKNYELGPAVRKIRGECWAVINVYKNITPKRSIQIGSIKIKKLDKRL